MLIIVIYTAYRHDVELDFISTLKFVLKIGNQLALNWHPILLSLCLDQQLLLKQLCEVIANLECCTPPLSNEFSSERNICLRSARYTALTLKGLEVASALIVMPTCFSGKWKRVVFSSVRVVGLYLSQVFCGVGGVGIEEGL